MQLGFSTGAIAFADFRLALERLRPFHLQAVELSALRAHEFMPLIEAIETLDLAGYSYVAFHAPSQFPPEDEARIVAGLEGVINPCTTVVVHPDAIHNKRLWARLGRALCFENMDKRKCIGRTAAELATLFDKLPDASLCLDLGHAWQIDRTMTEARQIVRRFSNRIRQLHISEVNTRSQHVPLTLSTVTAFRKVVDILPDVPWILESVVEPEKIGAEIAFVRESFSHSIVTIPD
jgi:sugar phosphate isomerase/epimerase